MITRSGWVSTPTEGLHQGEIPVFGPVDASIQLKTDRSGQAISYPGPSNSLQTIPSWVIFFKGPREVVHKGDKITDDLGNTYEVDAPYWNSLGYALEARGYTPT